MLLLQARPKIPDGGMDPAATIRRERDLRRAAALAKPRIRLGRPGAEFQRGPNLVTISRIVPRSGVGISVAPLFPPKVRFVRLARVVLVRLHDDRFREHAAQHVDRVDRGHRLHRRDHDRLRRNDLLRRATGVCRRRGNAQRQTRQHESYVLFRHFLPLTRNRRSENLAPLPTTCRVNLGQDTSAIRESWRT